MENFSGFILTGGASRRMGRDKASLNLGGKTFVERAADSLRAVARNLFLVGGELENSLNLPVLHDIYKSSQANKKASIIGLHAALFHSKTEWTIVLACDLPFASDALFRRLISFIDAPESDFDAIVPIQPDGRMQPLAALYKTKICLPEIEKMLAGEGSVRLQEFVRRINARRVEFEEITDLPNAENLFLNVNAPEDLRRAAEIETSLEM